MTFDRLWVLWLLSLPVLWAGWEFQRTARRGALLVKAVAFALIVLALAEPKLRIFESKVAVTVLLDTSASIPPGQREESRRLARELQSARGRNELRLLHFDETTRSGDGPDPADAPDPAGASAPAGVAASAGTNLEIALRNGLATLPPGRVPRLVLISDGKATAGSVERAVFQARGAGVPIDTFLLEGRPEPELRLLSLSAPSHAYAGEDLPMELRIASPRNTSATVQLTAEGKTIGESRVELAAGENRVDVRAKLNTEGAVLLSGRISIANISTARAPDGDMGELRFEHVVRVERPKVLLISADDPAEQSHLEQVLASAGFESHRGAAGDLSSLADYRLLIADNQDLEKWPLAAKRRAEEFVANGGGFLLIAGENNLYGEPAEDRDDPLAKMLPAELAPPRSPEGTSVVLVLDKSSSMEGKKMQLARQSAIGVVENLRPIDRVGVLVFDNSFQWAVPLRPNRAPEAVKQLISGIIADGGTQIAPALHEAFRLIRETDSVYKHILLLTDGISEEGDSIALAREAAKEQVTISTVGLGQDVNRAYLERVASTAEGRSHFLIDVSALEQIVLRDVMEHTGSSIMETSVVPEQLGEAEILDGVELEEAGPLLGWVKFDSKPAAETILTIGEEEEKDPLLVRWQYGLGRSAVFASDAKARWAANWVGWEGFDRFWTNVLRDLLPRSPATEAVARYESSTDELVIRYRTSPAADRPGSVASSSSSSSSALAPPDLYVLGPGDFRRTATLRHVANNEYEARLPLENRFGLFRARPAAKLDRFPEIAFYRANSELGDYGSNAPLLKKIAAETGGRFQPSAAQVFDAQGRSVPAWMNLWAGFLALALLLSLFELLGRKGWLPWLRGWV